MLSAATAIIQKAFLDDMTRLYKEYTAKIMTPGSMAPDNYCWVDFQGLDHTSSGEPFWVHLWKGMVPKPEDTILERLKSAYEKGELRGG